MDDEALLPCYIERRCEHTSMMPESIKLVFPLILHSTFDTFSSVTLGASSGASGDDSLDKISHYVTASRIERDNDEATHVRTKVPVIYWSMNEARAREVLAPRTETPGTSLRRLVNCVQHSSASGSSQLHR
jgi:hypothetical protein